MQRKSSTIGATTFDVPATGPYKRYVKRCGFYCWYDGEFIGARSNPLDADRLLAERATAIARLAGWAEGYRQALAEVRP